MRTRPAWYESFVERPLGAKQAPVASALVDAYGEPAAPLVLGEPDVDVDNELVRLANDAVRLIDHRVTHGEQAREIAAEVIRGVFDGPFTGTLDRAPHATADPLGGITGALIDRERLDRIVTTVMAIIAEGNGPRARS